MAWFGLHAVSDLAGERSWTAGEPVDFFLIWFPSFAKAMDGMATFSYLLDKKRTLSCLRAYRNDI